VSVAGNTFVADTDVAPPTGARLPFQFTVQHKGKPAEAYITLQLCLKPGEAVETGTGRKIMLGTERVALAAKELGGSLQHRGWTLTWDAAARLDWPVFPYNPYAEGPETSLEFAVGALTFPPEAIKFNPEAK
jgi:hypothetical protein